MVIVFVLKNLLIQSQSSIEIYPFAASDDIPVFGGYRIRYASHGSGMVNLPYIRKQRYLENLENILTFEDTAEVAVQVSLDNDTRAQPSGNGRSHATICAMSFS